MPAKTMTGARAQLIVADATSQQGQVVGIFSNVSYGLALDAQPIFILGRYSPAETVYTASEAVNVTATGFRVIENGPHIAAKVPKLQDLMNHEYMELAVYDRQTNQRVAKIHSVRPTGYSTSVAARGIQEVTVTFIGLLIDDESTPDNAESVPKTDIA